jgi:HlyD family secretion protein
MNGMRVDVKKGFRKGGLLLMALAVVGVAGSGCVDKAAQQQAKKTEQLVTDPTKPVFATPVAIQTLTQTIEITGEVTTSNDVTVGSKNAGRLVSVLVQDGDPVRRGQLIAEQDISNQRISLQGALSQAASARSSLTQAIANMRIGPQKSQASVLQAQAQLAQSQAQLQKALNGARSEERVQATAMMGSAKSTMDTAKRQRDRQRQLLDQGAISQQEFDTAENAYETAEALYQNSAAAEKIMENQTRPEDIQAAKDAVQQARQNLSIAKSQKQLDSLFKDQVDAAKAGLQSALSAVQLAQQQIQDAQIRAPFDGRIEGKPAQIGTVLGAGGAIAHIVGRAGVYFEGQVSENDIAAVHIGSMVSVSLDAIAGRTFSGHIAAMGPSASSVGRLFTVRVQLDSFAPDVKPGMFARGDVTVKRIEGAKVVPSTAIVEKNGQSYVFVINGKKAHMEKVTLGLKQGDFTEVNGVAAGQQVVTTGQTDLAEGTPIQIQTQSAAAAKGA